MPTANDRVIGCATCGKSITCDAPFGRCWKCEAEAAVKLCEMLRDGMLEKYRANPTQLQLPGNHC